MLQRFVRRPRVRLARGALLLALLLPAIGVTPAAVPVPRAPAALLALAAAQPAAPTQVIVEKAGHDTRAEQAVAALGGHVTKDLALINAFVADLPASGARDLASTPGVRWVTLDAPIVKADCDQCVDTSRLASAYIRTIGADRVWNETPGYDQGQGVGVAVIDTGITRQPDLNAGHDTRVVAAQRFLTSTTDLADNYGHGTHIAGLIGGNGRRSQGTYIGVAPRVNLLNLKVSDNNGLANTSDVIAAMIWIYYFKSVYNIRVVNLSFSSSLAESYQVDPLDAAAEILWFNGIVVVASAGNNGQQNTGVLNAPANDPFVITVGATNDQGTPAIGDDIVAPYSSYGLTEDGLAKPDLVAPGTNLVSLLAGPNAALALAHPDHIVAYNGSPAYFRMSGTSMAAAVTSGAVALLLRAHPTLNPDQVKYRLLATADPLAGPGAGAGSLDAYAAVHGTSTATANTGTPASWLLTTGSQPINWGSINWNSINWNSINWNSINWNSINWNSVDWSP